MLLDHCFLTVSLAIPVAVMLSQYMGVGGCLWPISSRVILIILPSLAFMNSAASSASAADATTLQQQVLPTTLLRNSDQEAWKLDFWG